MVQQRGLGGSTVYFVVQAQLSCCWLWNNSQWPRTMIWPSGPSGRLVVVCESGEPVGCLDADAELLGLRVLRRARACRDQQGRVLRDGPGRLATEAFDEVVDLVAAVTGDGAGDYYGLTGERKIG